MHFEPNPAWCWTYSAKRRRILIRIVDAVHSIKPMYFMTAYDLGSLFSSDVADMKDEFFNVDDASFFYYVLQAVHDLPYTSMEKIQLALNAVTIKHFHHKGLKGLENLKRFQLMSRMPYTAEVFSVQDELGHVPGDVLTVIPYEKSSVCMVLATGLEVNDSSHKFMDLVVINNDELIPLYKMNHLLQGQMGL